MDFITISIFFVGHLPLPDTGISGYTIVLNFLLFGTVLGVWIRIHRIPMFLGLPDPDPLVRAEVGTDLDPTLDPFLFPINVLSGLK
jgi:hypothetical protein